MNKIMKNERRKMRRWLNEHNCLSMACLERAYGLPLKCMDHFAAGRRDIPDRHLEAAKRALMHYGYKP